MTQYQNNTPFPKQSDQIIKTFEFVQNLIKHNKINEACKILLNIHNADIGDFLENTTNETLYNILPKITQILNPEVLAYVNNNKQETIIKIIGIHNSVQLINKLEIDNAIEILNNITPTLKNKILNKLNTHIKKSIIQKLTLPYNTAGKILEKHFITLKSYWNCGQALSYIKNNHTYRNLCAALIINERKQPIGDILIITLLMYPYTTLIKNIMNNCHKINIDTTFNDIIFIFKQYALTIAPIVNKQGKLIGTISVQNIIQNINQQDNNNFPQSNKTHTIDIFSKTLIIIQHRLPWLIINLITACSTSIIINQFNNTITKLITLATLMPVVASIGGNTGTQSMTLIIRALINNRVTKKNKKRIILKEICICIINGCTICIVGIVLTFILFQHIKLSITFGVAIIINICLGGFLGICIPLILNNFNIDPATASGVFLTTLTDALGFFCFLTLARIFLI